MGGKTDTSIECMLKMGTNFVLLHKVLWYMESVVERIKNFSKCIKCFKLFWGLKQYLH
jgi:hypothetical protein